MLSRSEKIKIYIYDGYAIMREKNAYTYIY